MRLSLPRLTLTVLAAGLLLWPALLWAQTPAELEKGIRDALIKGREMDACQLAIKMQPFKGQPGYAEAKQLLLQHGISLDAPLESLTVKRMVALQNKLESQRAKTQALPQIGPYPDHRDAWGTPIRVEMTTRRVFVYLLRAAGPDRIFMTDDDLAIATRDEATSDTRKRDLRPGLSGRAPLDDLPGGPADGGSQPGSGGSAGEPGGGQGGSAGGTGGGQGGSVIRSLPDPARSAGKRGLYGVTSAPPTSSQSSGALEPIGAGGPVGAGAKTKDAGGGKSSAPPEREVTVDELLKR